MFRTRGVHAYCSLSLVWIQTHAAHRKNVTMQEERTTQDFQILLTTSLRAATSPGPLHIHVERSVIVTASSKAHTASEVPCLSSHRCFHCVKGPGPALQVRLWHGVRFAFRAPRSCASDILRLQHASRSSTVGAPPFPDSTFFQERKLVGHTGLVANPRTIALVLGLVCRKPEASPTPRQALQRGFPVHSIGAKPVVEI